MSDDPDLFEPDDIVPDDGNPFGDAGEARKRQIERGELEPSPRDMAREDTRKGRPRGALNRKTKDFERFYAAHGFTDPLVAMARFLTADPVELQAWFIEHERTVKALGKGTVKAAPSLFELIREQMTVASQIAPYLHGKKPVEVQIIDDRLPRLFLNLGTNQLDQARAIEQQRGLSAGSAMPDEPESEANEINDLADGEE